MGDLDDLAAGFPSWRIWRHTETGAFMAWRPGVRPPFRFREASLAALRERLEWAQRVDEERAKRNKGGDEGDGD